MVFTLMANSAINAGEVSRAIAKKMV